MGSGIHKRIIPLSACICKENGAWTQQNVEWCVHYCFTPLGGTLTLNLFMHFSKRSGPTKRREDLQPLLPEWNLAEMSSGCLQVQWFSLLPELLSQHGLALPSLRNMLRMPQRARFGSFPVLTLCMLHQFFRLRGETRILLFVHWHQKTENFVLRV